MRKSVIAFGIALQALAPVLPVVATAQQSSTGINVNGSKLSNDLTPMHLDNPTYIPVEAATGPGLAVSLEQTDDVASEARTERADYPNPILRGLAGKENADAVLRPAPDGLTEVHTIQASEDGLVVRADGQLYATIYKLSDPHRIVLDFSYSRLAGRLNGKFAKPAGELLSNHPSVTGIRYEWYRGEPSTIRLVVGLKRETEYCVETEDTGAVILSIPRETVMVAIDAGHGGHDSGSAGSTGKEEKTYTLELARKVERLLQSEIGVTPILIRGDDRYVSPRDRSAAANEADADLFLSIHANSFTSADTRGTETYYHHRHSGALAETMHRHVLEATGFPDRGIHKKDYIVNEETAMPSALLEIGYLSNPDEEAALWSKDMMNRVAEAIVKGIKAYIQIARM